MKKYVQYLNYNMVGDLVDSGGSFGILPLDGRKNIESHIFEAELKKNYYLDGKPQYVAYKIMDGNLRNSRQIYFSFLPEYKKLHSGNKISIYISIDYEHFFDLKNQDTEFYIDRLLSIESLSCFLDSKISDLIRKYNINQPFEIYFEEKPNICGYKVEFKNHGNLFQSAFNEMNNEIIANLEKTKNISHKFEVKKCSQKKIHEKCMADFGL